MCVGGWLIYAGPISAAQEWGHVRCELQTRQGQPAVLRLGETLDPQSYLSSKLSLLGSVLWGVLHSQSRPPGFLVIPDTLAGPTSYSAAHGSMCAPKRAGEKNTQGGER